MWKRADRKLFLDAAVIQQGRLAEQNTSVNKQDLMAMVRFGADEIFASKSKQLTDEDIDVLLKRGEERTAEQNKKIETDAQHNLANFSLTTQDAAPGSLFEFEGANYRGAKGAGLLINLPTRERKRNYDVDEYFRDTLNDGRRSARSRGRRSARARRCMISSSSTERSSASWSRRKNASSSAARTRSRSRASSSRRARRPRTRPMPKRKLRAKNRRRAPRPEGISNREELGEVAKELEIGLFLRASTRREARKKEQLLRRGLCGNPHRLRASTAASSTASTR